MKKLLKYITLPVFSGILLTGCKQEFLDTKPLDKASSADTWKDASLSEAFVTGIYSGLGQGGFDEQMLASLSDEAVFTHPNRGINVVNEGVLNPSNLGWVNVNYRWGKDGGKNDMYAKIRQANLALENLRTATFEDVNGLKTRLQGEAHFLRAFYYHQLVRYYGAVPIIDKSYKLDDDFSIARNTWDECVTFILKDCDSAITELKDRTMPDGKANEIGAMALKARMLLYAASDLHDIPTAKAKSATIAGFSKPELLGYPSGDRNARWKAAQDAAKAIMDKVPGRGYKLDLNAPVSLADGKLNYISLSMGGASKAPGLEDTKKEILFGRFFTSAREEGGMQIGLYNGPNGYHNWAGNSPIQQLVDDYEMMDGSKFDWTDAAQKAAPYKNRDPRFYATILYDGADWKPRDKASGNVDPASQIQTGRYDVGGGTMLAGLDTRSSSIENWNGSWSGYYMRKFIDPDPNLVDNNARQTVPWPFFRYTEIVFNYIEACIELGEETEAKNWLNKIRFRAGMPAITESGAALKARYQNERRVELAYEDHRYHDARRWMIAPTTLGRPITFISVVGNLKAGATAPSPYRYDESKYNYTYTPTAGSQESRKWDDKMYFRPIPLDEMNTNTKLVQNPGY
ncbi:RagB/SusD family nutrient uptake outer membrane protein [Pseudoflavitalea sp. X16]|uniref:RagB/SusD family nutrient uptake outer membrane protein n=1 Tax=Paraflavitalea devenefica TaxID=2716334 RepID=UPI00141F25FE|nr:RagB/SusD family nutrient uptake outer membrane protein [Paraflavitalea devenefica]NII23542.1 RagB/SusD family nutrient uptake outer membrane protein [Paraflavitalea devenefica]